MALACLLVNDLDSIVETTNTELQTSRRYECGSVKRDLSRRVKTTF